MYRWLWIGSLATLLIGSTGCLHHNVRGGASCNSGQCGQVQGGGAGGCNECSGGSRGVLGKLKGRVCGSCGVQGCRGGCVAGPLGWQQGGLDYSSHLQPGLVGHNAAGQLNSRPFTAGPPTGQVGYPYYSVRGPRDFLLDNPPSIGR